MAATPSQPIRTRASGPAARAQPAQLPLAAAVTAGWAAVVSATPVLLAVGIFLLFGGTGEDASQVLRVGFAGWLLAHGVPVVTPIGPVSLAPLAVTALAAWRVGRAGVHTARALRARRRRTVLPAIGAAVAVAVVYGLIGTGIAAAVDAPGLDVRVARAGLTLGCFALVAALAGALVEGGWPVRLAAVTPPPLRDGVRTGVVAALLVLGAGAAVAGLSMAINAGRAGEVLQAYRTGVTGQAGLTLVCLVYAPTFAVWGASYLIGPGFTVGAGTEVSAGAVTLGGVPALPVFAALPGRPLAGWGVLLVGVPLVAGLAAGWLLARRRLREDGAVGWRDLAPGAALAGPVAGLLLAAATVAASGSLGKGRLSAVGPDAWPLAGIAALVVAIGAAVGAALWAARASRDAS